MPLPENKHPESLAGIRDDVLLVQVDLRQANGELMALGLLEKAKFMVQDFLLQKAMASEHKFQSEKGKIDAASVAKS